MSLIQHIRKLYINDEIKKEGILLENTSCEFTTLYILDKLKTLGLITYRGSFGCSSLSCLEENETVIMEIILFRRSHTFIILKEKDKFYIISSYLNLYLSNIKIIKSVNSLKSLLLDIYKIEYEDDGELHKKLFNVSRIPCMTLDKSFSKMKINLYNF
jgi:hypothetical protein